MSSVYFEVHVTPPPLVCVECLFCRTPSRAPYRTPPACAKRAAYSDPPPVVPDPESNAAQAAYTSNTEALLPRWAPARVTVCSCCTSKKSVLYLVYLIIYCYTKCYTN